MKFQFKSICRPYKGIVQTIVVMKLIAVMILVSFIQASASTYAQNLNINKTNTSLIDIFKEIRKQSGHDFLYSDKLIKSVKPLDVNIVNKSLNQTLDIIFHNLPIGYQINGTTIVLKEKNESRLESAKTNIQQTNILQGIVTDINGIPLIGASVSALKSKTNVSTDYQGRYSITIKEQVDSVKFSSVGYKPKTFSVATQKVLNIRLEATETQVQDVIVTGYFNRQKDSFTGAATTYSAQELKAVGNTNIIQSLKTLDPVFSVLENNQFGSDPNRLPDLEIRGKSSIVGIRDELSVDPNQPLFILDGFETSLRTIMDLDLERVASVTILKDAASTAIYGSKAANGVVVVETTTITWTIKSFIYK